MDVYNKQCKIKSSFLYVLDIIIITIPIAVYNGLSNCNWYQIEICPIISILLSIVLLKSANKTKSVLSLIIPKLSLYFLYKTYVYI